MSRIAILTDGGFLAHTTRSLEVGRALSDELGHHVVFGCSGPYARVLSDAGFEVRDVYTVDREETMRLARRAGVCSMSWWEREVERSIDSDIELLSTLRPDAVVGDMHWSLCTSARVLAIPYVAITNAAWTRHYAQPIHAPSGHFTTRLFGPRLTERMFPTVKALILRYWALGYRNVRKRYALPAVTSLYDLIEGDLTLLADIPEFGPTAELPANIRYVGPIPWRAELPAPAWLRSLDPTRPTLYFTLGSTGDAEFFEEAVRVFGNTEYQVLITTGGISTGLHRVPSNIFVEKYAPGDALLGVSDAVVSHGGNGTIYQALQAGVPVIGFPSIFDQEINMQRVQALGIGVSLWRSHYGPETLRAAVETILGDSQYKERCRFLGKRCREMAGAQRAAAHIHDVLRAPLGRVDGAYAAAVPAVADSWRLANRLPG
jgi:MGT family glycosyltransferase